MSDDNDNKVVVKDYAQDEARNAPAEGSEYPPSRTPDIYDRFSSRRKSLILALVSYNAFLSPMTASIFLPAVPAIAEDLNTTPTIVNVTIALFIVSIGTAPLFWSPLSGFYGRRPIYLASAPIMLIASIGVAFSQTVPQLIVTRILQGVGSSSVLSVGAGSIGDIYRPTERSNAMGWFYTGALLGPSVSPVLGAALTEYTAQSWRSTQYFLVGCSALSVVLTYFFLPETMHPPTAHQKLCEQRGKRFVSFIFNPLAILGLFAWPNISCITFISSATMLMTYVILIPITSAFSDQYGINNVFILGCLYLATGGGNIIGSRIIGPMADAAMQRWIKKRGHRRPEDRLRIAIFGLGVQMPLSCLAYGWLLQTKKGGIGPPVVFMILNGMGLMFTLTPLNTYAVDSMQDRSAEVIAVNNWMRYLFAAAASAFVLPMADAIGWGLTMTVASIIVWISFGILLLVIRYGHIWREAANLKHGYLVQAEDEKHGPEKSRSSASAEAGQIPCPSVPPIREGHEGHEGEHLDEPGDLPSKSDNTLPQFQRAKSARSRGQGALPMANALASGNRPRSGSRASRMSKDGMPDVQEVLQRTTSLSGASVHGG